MSLSLIVGESDCGKSTPARLLLRLIAVDRGRPTLDGADTGGLSDADRRARRRRMQLIYQDATGALDPRMRVRAHVVEALHFHRLPLG